MRYAQERCMQHMRVSKQSPVALTRADVTRGTIVYCDPRPRTFLVSFSLSLALLFIRTHIRNTSLPSFPGPRPLWPWVRNCSHNGNWSKLDLRKLTLMRVSE